MDIKIPDIKFRWLRVRDCYNGKVTITEPVLQYKQAGERFWSFIDTVTIDNGGNPYTEDGK